MSPIPNAEQLSVISQMTRGDLAEISFPVLLHAFAVHKRSVVLSIERRMLKKEIILENGVPVDCHSNLLQDTLGKFMVGRGDITEEQNQVSLSKAATAGLSVSEIMVKDGWVSASDLYKILQQNLGKKLLDCFAWRNGEFAVSTNLPNVESPLKVRVPQLLLTGVTKLALQDEVERAMEAFGDKKLFLNPRAPFPLKEIRLGKDHQELVGLVSLGKTIAELEAESGMPRPKLLRLLFALAVISTIVPEEWLATERREAVLDQDFVPSVESTSAQPPVSSEAPPADLDRVRNELMEAYLLHRKQDAIDLLGIADEAGRDEIEAGYIAFAEKYAPWRFNHPGLESLQEKARDLFIAGGRAFGELTNPETRNSLIARRNSRLEQRLTSEEAANAFAIKSNLLDAETQFKKGMELLKAGRYSEAQEQLEYAHDFDPQNSVYRAELAHCKYRKEPEIERERSLEELRETVRIDPECGLALYYLGMILGEAGNFDEAEPWLQRAIKLMAPDRRPIDALKQFMAAAKEGKKKFF